MHSHWNAVRERFPSNSGVKATAYLVPNAMRALSISIAGAQGALLVSGFAVHALAPGRHPAKRYFDRLSAAREATFKGARFGAVVGTG